MEAEKSYCFQLYFRLLEVAAPYQNKNLYEELMKGNFNYPTFVTVSFSLVEKPVNSGEPAEGRGFLAPGIRKGASV